VRARSRHDETRPPYPEQFRLEAVELVRSGRSIRDVAERLGVSQQTLRNWATQVAIDRRERDDGLTRAERAELRELRTRVSAWSRSATASSGPRLSSRGDRDPVTVYRHVSAERAHCTHPVSLMCELLGVSESAY
jgi:transposase-like protein